MFEAARPKPRNHRRLQMAAAVAGAILLVGLPTSLWVSAQTGPKLFVPPSIAQKSSDDTQPRERWLDDVLAAQAAMRAAQVWEPTTTQSVQPNGAEAALRIRTAAPKAGGGKRAGSPRRTTTLSTAPEPLDNTDPAFAALFGSASRYAQASAHPTSAGRGAPNSKQGQNQAQGRLLHVRFIDEVASQPVGAPVIAQLTRAVQMGDVLLPAGAQVHGAVRGAAADSDRIFVDFNFVRLAAGDTFDISGSARDVRGRQGVTGRRRLDERTAGSVGLAAAGRAAQAAGHHLAGVVGSVLGAGVEGAADAGRDKVRRLDRDETVVVVRPGTRFDIYVTTLGARDAP